MFAQVIEFAHIINFVVIVLVCKCHTTSSLFFVYLLISPPEREIAAQVTQVKIIILLLPETVEFSLF